MGLSGSPKLLRIEVVHQRVLPKRLLNTRIAGDRDVFICRAQTPTDVAKRIGVPLESNGTPHTIVSELIAVDDSSASLVTRLFHGLETSAVDDFTQLGFSQLLIVVLDYGLAFV